MGKIVQEKPRAGFGYEEKVHYENRNFIRDVLPFSMHTDFRTREHADYVNQHRDIEILTALSGSGQVIVDLKPIPFSEGDTVVVNSNKTHNIVTDGEIAYYCLIVDIDFMRENGMDPALLCFEDRFSDPELSDMIRKLDDEWQYHDNYRSLCMRALLTQIMVRLCRFHVVEETLAETESRSRQKIKQAIGYIKSHFRQELSLEEIAKEAGLSKYYFCREFRKATTLTPIEFINYTRCEYAKNLLETGTHTVYEIAEICGYSTPSHFSKTFHRFYGIYPSYYGKNDRDGRGKERLQ